MSNINRLIALNPLQNNTVDSYQRGIQQGQNATARDLQNTAAQNQLDKQANVNRLLQSGASLEQVAQVDPVTARKLQQVQQTGQANKNTQKDRIFESLAFNGFNNTKILNPDLNLDPAFAVFDNDSPEQLQLRASLQKNSNGGLASAKTEILDGGTVIQALPDGTVQVRDPSGKVVTGEERLEALKQSRQQALNTLSEQTDIKSKGAGDAETEKLKSQLKLKPQLEADVTNARLIAQQKGEAFTELNQMNAALPGLKNTINTLRELAPIATSTLGGRVFDVAIKETGFGATEGATARAKFIAIINNQVLPLLKQTFGGSFSIQEGQELKASMGDPNATPDEKMAQLDAFIAQKQRDIQERENILNEEPLSPEEQAELEALEIKHGNRNP